MKYRLLFLMILPSLTLCAQSQTHHETHHGHHKHEIGIANSPVYFAREKEFAYGLHLHFIRYFNHSKLGIGAGYERIFDDHKHNTLGIVLNYRPADGLNLNFSPGITFEDDESASRQFAMHFEASYEFEIHNFHTGPLVEFAYDAEDYHISLGLHVGYGF